MSWNKEFTSFIDAITQVSFNMQPVESLKIRGQQIWYSSLDETSKFYKVPFYIQQKVVYQNELKVISFMNSSYFEITPDPATREFYIWFEHGDPEYANKYKLYPKPSGSTYEDVVDGIIEPLDIQSIEMLKGDTVKLENAGDDQAFLQNSEAVVVAEQDMGNYVLEYIVGEEGEFNIYNNDVETSLPTIINVANIESELINIHDLQGKIFGPFLDIDDDDDGVDAGVDINDTDPEVGSTITVQILNWASDGIESIQIDEGEKEPVDLRIVNPKDIVTVEAQPDLGKIFDQWEITGIEGLVYSDLLNPIIKFTMPRNNVTLNPIYKDEII